MGGGKSKEAPAQKNQIDFKKFPARVDRVKVDGLGRTHDDYVQRAIRNLFSVKTFEEIVIETNIAKDNLSELGIFKNIRVLIDVSKGEGATQNGYEVTFHGKELSRLTGSIGTELGQNDGAATAELVSPNLFGRGETCSLNASYSYIKTTELNLRLMKPFLHTVLGDYKPETSLTLFRHSSMAPWSKYKSDDTGILLDFSFLTPFGLSNSLQYEVGMKELFALDKLTPFFVREQCGPKLSSLFRYIGSYEGRDSTIFPTEGIFVRSTAELMGSSLKQLGIVRTDSHAEINMPLFLGMSVQICGRFGMLLNDKKKEIVPINQLFFPGGPQSFRGFEQAGAGPQRDGVAAGCQAYWTSGVHIWSPLPFNSYFGGFGNLFRTHLFYNFGSCNNFTKDDLRSSAGIGLAFRLGDKARIEFNYCHPILTQPGDHVKKGFQFGIGYDFI